MEAVVFAFNDYKTYLKALTGENRGLLTKLAEAAPCQRSYLSKVLHEHVHITPDQAFGIASFLKLSPQEKEYFLALVDYERSGSPTYRAHLKTKLKQLKEEHENLAARLHRARIEPGEKEFLYYSAWYWSAIHVAVSIPQLQTAAAIALHLQLPLALVENALTVLAKHNLVSYQRGRWTYASGDIHIPKDSLFVGLHHNNWRQRAIMDAQRPNGDGLHYTVVQSMDRAAFEKIKQDLMDTIESAARIANPSPCEELVGFTLDFFRT